ncbi:MAG: hypothetical protein ACRCZF_08180, partial [Gemmataceae bacterium]
MKSCPPDKSWNRLLDSPLDQGPPELEEHLTGCSRCQRRLLQLSDPTGLLACLGSSEEGEELPSPPFFQALLQQVEEA